MQSIRLFILAAAFFLLPSALRAQMMKKAVVIDTVQVPFINGVSVHADLVGAAMMKMSDHGQIDIGARVNIKDRYFPALEAGYGICDEKEAYVEHSCCKVKAPFARIGCDFNVLRNKHDIYKVFGGFRYAVSHFNYDLDTPDGNSYTDLTATYHWLEGVFGVDAKVWGPMHLGWDVRYRRMLTGSHSQEARPWYVPGLGNYSRAGFNLCFYLTFAI